MSISSSTSSRRPSAASAPQETSAPDKSATKTTATDGKNPAVQPAVQPPTDQFTLQAKTAPAKTVSPSVNPTLQSRESFMANVKLSSSAPAAATTSPATPQTPAMMDLSNQLTQAKVNHNDVQKILTNAQTAMDGSKPPADRLKAAIDMTNKLKDVLPADQLAKLPDMVQKVSDGLPAASKLLGMAQTLSDPNASALSKAKSVVDFAGAAAEHLPEGSKQKLLETAGKFGAPISTVQNFMKVTDSNLPLAERGKAFVDLIKGLGDSVKSVKDIGKALDDLGVFQKLGVGPDSAARKMFDDVAGAMDGMLSKLGANAGEKLGKEVLEKAGKALGKIIPALGSVISGIDTVRLGAMAADSKLPGEMRYLAGIGAGLNGIDTALGVAEAFGVGNIGLPANIALGVAEFGVDVALDKMKADHEAGKFNPSKEMRALIGASALATGPTGLGLLTTSFGPGGALGVMKDTVEVGGKYAKDAAEAVLKFAKEQGEEALKDAEKFFKGLPGNVADAIGGVGNFLGGIGDALGGFAKKLPVVGGLFGG